MNELVYLIYPLLVLLLLWKAERLPVAEASPETDTLPGRDRTKPLLGFFAVCILMHHISQKTSAPWLPAEVRRAGLEPFVPTGYLFVSLFFFVSGLGLWKSSREKEDYLEDFPDQRIFPLVLTFAVTELLYLLARLQWGNLTLPANGYSWYFFAILIFYLLFYLIQRLCPKTFFPLMLPGIALYCVICRAEVAGEWWYNTAPAFAAGLIAGKHEKRTAQCLRRIPVVAVLLLLTVLTAVPAELPELISTLTGNRLSAGTVYDLQVLLEMVAGVCFPLLMMAFLLRVKVGNRLLEFLGSLTLEFYLIQGLFVQLFGFSFMEDSVPPVCYIRNVALYCLVVTALTVMTAWLLRKVCSFSCEALRHSGFARMVWKDTKTLFRVLVILAVVITAFMATRTRVTARNRAEQVRAFRENDLTCVSAGGKEAAISTIGEGEHTVVLLGDEEISCPTLLLEELAERLSSVCTVMTVDRLGTGFSEDTDAPRTAENIARELHEMLCGAEADFPVILCAHGTSGLYALEYAELYPSEVRAIIGLDAYVPAWGEYVQSSSGYAPEEYAWRSERAESRSLRWEHLEHFLGFDRWSLTALDMLDHGTHRIANREILEELYLEGLASRAAGNERMELYENTRRLSGMRVPEDLPCCFLIHYALTGDGGADWEQMTQSVISNDKIQKTILIAGNPYGIVTDPAPLAEQITSFLSQLP